MTVIEFAEARRDDPNNEPHETAYWSAYLDGAMAQRRESPWISADDPPKEGGRYLVLQRGSFNDMHYGIAAYSQNLHDVDEFSFSKDAGAGWCRYYSEYGYVQLTNVGYWAYLPPEP